MILCTFQDDWAMDIDAAAAKMVAVSMERRSSVCAIIKGIPLVTYPNDCRTPKERIKNLVFAFTDGWLRSQMENDSNQTIDARFDPRFDCRLCRIGACREAVLGETLAALAGLAMKKMPNDEEIASLASAASTILQSTNEQRNMVEQFGKMLKP
jgi:hypothetical protein